MDNCAGCGHAAIMHDPIIEECEMCPCDGYIYPYDFPRTRPEFTTEVLPL